MKIKLLTDASCLFPKELMEKENIGFFESILIIDGKDHRELTELNFEDFVNSLHDLEPYPSSSQATPGDALDILKKTIDDGYEEALYLGITPKISSQMNVVRLASKTVKKQLKLHIYPTELSVGSQGAMVRCNGFQCCEAPEERKIRRRNHGIFGYNKT